jgi:glutamate-1-semialdehyde 2,1-aminomutase
MMNAGFVLPEEGYLQGVKDLLHEHGALLVFDEVKTGATLSYGGAVEAFGVTPDLLCLAKSVGGGLPCGAIGGTDEVMGWIADGKIDQVGTFNGNPLTMAAMNATLTEILVPDAYTEFSRLGEILREGCDGVIASNGLAGYTTVLGARGAVTYRAERVRNYRDYLEVSDQLAYVNWLAQFNRGVFMAPWGKSENWTLTVQHSEEDVRRYVDNFEYLGKALSA